MVVVIPVQFESITHLLDEARALREAAKKPGLTPEHRRAFIQAADKRRMRAVQISRGEIKDDE